ncbi:MAG: hypothetical protein ACR2NL_08010 [Acidimicrobiia bacterium]
MRTTAARYRNTEAVGRRHYRLIGPLCVIAMLAATLSAAPAAARHTPDGSTVLLDAFEGTTQGVEYGSLEYEPSLPGLDQAIELGTGDWVKYSVPGWYQWATTYNPAGKE